MGHRVRRKHGLINFWHLDMHSGSSWLQECMIQCSGDNNNNHRVGKFTSLMSFPCSKAPLNI